MSTPAPTLKAKIQEQVIVFFEKLGLVTFSAAGASFLANHAKLSELTALETGAIAGGIAGLTYLLGKANQWLQNNP